MSTKIVLWFLLLTSVPAGFLPFLAAGSYREQKTLEQVNGKWRKEATIESARSMTSMATGGAVVELFVQLLMTTLALKNWDGELMGTRGAVWMVMIWCAFAVGAGCGVWIYNAMPKY